MAGKKVKGKSIVSKKGNASKRGGKKQNTGQKITIREEIILWLVLALSIVILISNFGFGGFIGNAVSGVLFGLFGFLAYLLPFVLLLTVAFNISNKGNKIAWVKSGAVLILWVCLCALMELMKRGNDATGNFLKYYKESSQWKTGGGLIGGLVCRPLSAGIGVVGAGAVLVILGIICIVLITEKSLFAGMKKSGSRVYHTAKQDVDYRRERAAIRREQREVERKRKIEAERTHLLEEQEEFEKMKQELRMERRVSGVSLDTLIEPQIKEKKENRKENRKPEESGEKKEIVLGDFTIERDRTEETEEQDMFSDTRQKPYQEFQEEPEEEFIEIPLSEEENFTRIPVEGEPEKHMKNPHSSRKEQEEGIKAVAQEIEETAKEQPPEYVFPPIDLLKKPRRGKTGDSDRELRDTAAKLQNTLHNFGVEVSVTNVSCGPTVTRYELTPKQGVKVSRIVNLADDIKLNLAAADIRIEAPIPGKPAVGIEVPNKENSPVMLRELLESQEFQKHPSNLAFAAGKDIAGKVVMTDIAKMPHLLIAGATGSGKSVCINTIIMSILYKAKPEDVKLIMIDPKVVELSVYNGIPHLFIPVVTDPKKAAGALNWGVAEMTERYQKFAELNVRDLKGYNEKVASIQNIDEEGKPEKMPQIVIIVDELADLMMVAPGEVEDAVCRLAQLARAAGIHLIIATQRPSVNVITGLIKANMPSRIAFSVSSGVDSRTIIDMVGAEKLLGKGDMLFYPQGYSKPARVQGAFVSDEEVGEVVEFLTAQNTREVYSNEIEERITKVQIADTVSGGSEVDTHFVEAGKFIIEKEKASIGMLQRVFKIGFNRAARIMDQLSDAGVVGPEEGTKPRKVLMTMEEFEKYLEESV